MMIKLPTVTVRAIAGVVAVVATALAGEQER
jgi:hypothetical protein